MIPDTSRRVGLARALSKLGYCSRAQAAKLIRSGAVQLNGKINTDPESPVRLGHDRIEIAGQPLRSEAKIYLLMNKPRGVVTTRADERGRATVYDLLAEDMRWIAPVGRLDKASEGLLLLTNDSEWAARITDPQTHLEKTYHVQVGRLADHELVQQLTEGVDCGEGVVLRARRASLLRAGQRNCWLEIVLDEGKNRQIRRMLEALGVEVLRLVRVAVGPLVLGELVKGSWRSLTKEEKLALDRAMSGSSVR